MGVTPDWRLACQLLPQSAEMGASHVIDRPNATSHTTGLVVV